MFVVDVDWMVVKKGKEGEEGMKQGKCLFYLRVEIPRERD